MTRPRSPRARSRSARSAGRLRAPAGFSLLEVILAIAILTASIAVLGELVRVGSRSAQLARDVSQAELLCDSMMSEIVAGLAPTQAVRQAAYPDYPGWLYSIEQDVSGQSPQTGLLKLKVTVEQSPDEQRRPASFSLSQWILDPALAATPQLISPEDTTTSGAQSTTGSIR